MKKVLMLMLVLVSALTASAQEEEFVSRRHEAILPGRGHLNLETMLKGINTNMDISQLSLSELRVLRNAFAARQGYVFMSAEQVHESGDYAAIQRVGFLRICFNSGRGTVVVIVERDTRLRVSMEII